MASPSEKPEDQNSTSSENKAESDTDTPSDNSSEASETEQQPDKSKDKSEDKPATQEKEASEDTKTEHGRDDHVTKDVARASSPVKAEHGQDDHATKDTETEHGRDDHATETGESGQRVTGLLFSVLLLVLAFLLGSTVIVNNDVFTHLATGRVLLADPGQIGTDPFGFTTENVTWVNHSWLFDIFSYATYSLSESGVFLVIFRSLFVVGLCWVCLQYPVKREHTWLLVLIAAVGFVVLSPRLLYQPAVVSFFFLGLTLLILYRPATVTLLGKTFNRVWLLVPLFVLWVNCDRWFILGPIVVGLFLLGEWLQTFIGGKGDEENKDKAAPSLTTLGLAFDVSLLACLINPHFHLAFRLPTEFSYILIGLGVSLPDFLAAGGRTVHDIIATDESFRLGLGAWDSPFTMVVNSGGGQMLTVAEFLFFCLLVATACSFMAGFIWDKPGRAKIRLASAFVWLFFLFLAINMERLIPFFAVAAIPTIFYNVAVLLPDFRSPEVAKQLTKWRQLIVISQALFVLGLLLMIVFTWPGWLLKPSDNRQATYRVGWELKVNSAKKALALRLEALAKDDLIRNGFAYNPDMACYCHFYAPHVKTYYDYRFDLYVDQGKEIAELRGAFHEPVKGPQLFIPGDLRRMQYEKFTELNVTHTILPEIHPRFKTKSMIGSLILLSKNWSLMGEAGSISAFRFWPEEKKYSRKDRKAVSIGLTEKAFKIPAQPPTPPVSGFATEPTDWDRFWQADPPDNPDRLSSAFYLLCYELLREKGNYEANQQILAYRASSLSVTTLGCPDPTGSTFLFRSAAERVLPRPVPSNNYPYAALSVLALRSARKALIEQPELWESHQAYFQAVANIQAMEDQMLGRKPGERDNSLRDKIRNRQKITCLYRIVQLNPDLFPVQLDLVKHYSRIFFRDMALEQLNLASESLNKRSLPGVTEEAQKFFQSQIKSFDKLKENVKFCEDYYHSRVNPKMSVLEKANLALNGDPNFFNRQRQPLGLAKKAYELLTKAKKGEFRTPREVQFMIRMRFELLENMGKLEEQEKLWKEWEEYQKDKKTDDPALWSVGMVMAANLGDYTLFEQLADKQESFLKNNKADPLLTIIAVSTPSMITEPLPTRLFHLHQLTRISRKGYLYRGPLIVFQDTLHELADLHIACGVVALEKGDIALAKQHFEKVRRMAEKGLNYPEQPIAATYLSYIRSANP